MDKLVVNRLVIVEGKYDKIRLENIIDAQIIAVNGFTIYNDKALKETLKSITHKNGAIILTDSDVAGYKIRVYLNEILNGYDIINLFAPEIYGKEKRKNHASASGLIGIEGTDDGILRRLFSEFSTDKVNNCINSIDLYELGYMGKEKSKERKNLLLKQLGVQRNISNKFLLRILNDKFTKEEFYSLDLKSK